MTNEAATRARRTWSAPALLLAGGFLLGCGEPTVEDEIVETLTEQSIEQQDAECVANDLRDADLTDEQLELMVQHDIQAMIPEGEDDWTLVLGLDGGHRPSDDDLAEINAALASAADNCLSG